MNVPEKLQWQALNHIKPEKSADWFWIVGITAISIAIVAVYFENYLFALIILLGFWGVCLQAKIPARTIQIEISRRGITVDKMLYPYTTLDIFCVVDEDGWNRDRILIKSKKIFMPLIVIPLGPNITPEMAQATLKQFMKEGQLDEPTFQKVMDRLGF